MIIIVSKYLIPKGYAGMALYPFILLGDKKYGRNAIMLNHEKIHLRQQAELLILPFYVWYFLEYCLRMIQYKNAHAAYRNISFEREAYANEKNPDYLKHRKIFTFTKYISRNTTLE